MSIDTSLPVDLAAVAAYQTAVDGLASRLGQWSDSVDGQRTKALANWAGGAADAFGDATRFAAQWTNDFATTTRTFANAVRTFHDSARAVKGRLDGLRDTARTGHLIVQGDQIGLRPAPTFIGVPGEPPSAQETAEVNAYNNEVALYNSLDSQRDEDFQDLYEAHVAFQRACAAVKPPGSIAAGDREQDALGTVQDWIDNGGDSTSLAMNWLLSRWGRYAPRGADGRFLPFTDDVLAKYSKLEWENWVRKPGTGDWWTGLKDRAPMLERGLKFVEGVGWVLTAASAIGDAQAQWDLDSHDPTLDGWEKGVRAVAAGIADEGAVVIGSVLGMLGGAAAGVALTSETGPGSVIGGLIGGIAGGVAGGAIGDSLHDTLHDWIDHIRW